MQLSLSFTPALFPRLFQQLLQSLQMRFSALIQAPDFPTQFQKFDTKWALLSLLEPMCGLAACTRVAYSQEFFQYLLPVLQASVNLLALYAGMADVVTVILELYVLVAENYIVFLDQVTPGIWRGGGEWGGSWKWSWGGACWSKGVTSSIDIFVAGRYCTDV